MRIRTRALSRAIPTLSPRPSAVGATPTEPGEASSARATAGLRRQCELRCLGPRSRTGLFALRALPSSVHGPRPFELQRLGDLQSLRSRAGRPGRPVRHLQGAARRNARPRRAHPLRIRCPRLTHAHPAPAREPHRERRGRRAPLRDHGLRAQRFEQRHRTAHGDHFGSPTASRQRWHLRASLHLRAQRKPCHSRLELRGHRRRDRA